MGGVLGGGGGGAQVAERLTTIALQRSSYGEVLPLVYGRVRVAPVLLWFGDFQAIAHEQDTGGSGGGGSITTYTYKASVLLGICEGPVSSVAQVWAEKQVTSLAALGLTFFSGAGGQATWSHLTSHHSSQAIPYDHTAYVAGNAIDLGSSAGIPNLNFLIQSSISFGGGVNDALPSAILADYLGDAEHGAQFPYFSTWPEWATYCQANGLFLSPAEVSQRQAADFLREMLQITNSNCRWSAGELQILPYGDAAITGNGATYTPDLTPEYSITDEDFYHEDGEPPVLMKRRAQSERFNRVRVEYLDASRDYNTAVAEAVDDADIALNGERPMDTLAFHSITSASTARLVAQLVLQRQLYVMNTYEFRLPADYSLLDPFDLLDLTETSLGLVNQLVRITSITDEPEHVLKIEAEEVPVGPHNAPRYNIQAAQGYAANYAADPGSVNAPFIFTAPPYLVGPAGGAEVWIAVNGSDADWGGCVVWASFDDNDYRPIGVVEAPSRYGVTQDAMSVVADPDSTSTITVQLNVTTLTLTDPTTADADNLRSLAYIGDPDAGEVVAYGGASLVGAGQYDLTYFRRGLYNTANASHASGKPFVRLDELLFRMPFDPGLAGQTVYFKFTSFNIYGGAEQDIATVTAYSYVLPTGLSGYVGDAVPLQVNGTTAYAGYSVFKPSGASSADSSVRSVAAYQNGCALSFRVARLDCNCALGLESDTAAFAAHDPPEYSFRFRNDGQAFVYENGTDVYTVGAYDVDETYTISYDGRTVRYYRDGVQLWATPAANKTLFLHGRLTTVGAHFDNIRFVPATGVHVVAGNLLNAAAWLIGGSDSQGNFAHFWDGTNHDSSIVLAGGSYPLGPYGQSEPLWRAQGTGTTANGGWSNSDDLLGVDPTKTYRTVCWVRWNGTGTPTLRLGFSTTNTVNLDGSANSNPYVFNANPATLGITANKWYLAVGIMHGAGYGTTDTGVAGIYDPATGQKVYDGSEFKFASATAPTQTQRVEQYGANNGSCVTYFSKPRFEQITGNEPSLQHLLSPGGALAYLNEVGTAQIAAEAASIVRLATAAGPTVADTRNTDYVLCSITVTTTGESVAVDGSCAVDITSDATRYAYHYLFVLVDGANVLPARVNIQATVGAGENRQTVFHWFHSHQPAAGSHTYDLVYKWSGGSLDTTSVDVTASLLKLREYKR